MAGATEKVAAKLAKARGTTTTAPVEPKAVVEANGRTKTKKKGKAPSPAQLAAREKFAAASRARAAAKKGGGGASKSASKKTKGKAKSSSTSRTRSKSKVTKPTRAVVSSGKAKRTTTPKLTTKNDNGAKARQMFEEGYTRRQIAQKLNLSYAAIHHHTKDLETDPATRGRIMVADPRHKGKGKAQQISRAEAFRREFEDGMDIGDIGRKHGVRYQVVYGAVKNLIDRG